MDEIGLFLENDFGLEPLRGISHKESGWLIKGITMVKRGEAQSASIRTHSIASNPLPELVKVAIKDT